MNKNIVLLLVAIILAIGLIFIEAITHWIIASFISGVMLTIIVIYCYGAYQFAKEKEK